MLTPARLFCLLAAFIGCSTAAHTQSNLFVREFSTDSNGIRTASSVFFDSQGKISSFDKSELSIMEGGNPARVIRVTCQPPGPVTEVSSVLTVDVSGSMRFGGPNITLATRAAQAWIDALSGASQAAITSFDHNALLQSDLTTDKEQLRSAVSRLRPRGGTSYVNGLLDPAMGGIAIASTGKYRRVLVFLTDGFGNVDPDTVIAKARAEHITVYCVTLGLNMPGVLQRIAEETGGLWFDNVTTVDQAIMAYQRIFADATGAGGCEIVWEPPPACEETTAFQATVRGATYSTQLPVPVQRRGGLDVDVTSVSFDSSTNEVRSFTIVNRSSASTITNVHNGRPEIFTIDHPPLPIKLAAGDTLRLVVHCKRIDSTYVVAQLTLEASPCPFPTLYMSAGNVMAAPSRPTLRVVSPNGGERIPVRTYEPLVWEGLPPNIPVRVEVSIDAGRTWSVIKEDAQDLRLSWHTGRVASDSCLLRVTHLKRQRDISKPVVTIPGGKFSDVEYSPDGSLLVTGETPNVSGSSTSPSPITIWNGETGQMIKKLGNGQFARFSRDGSRLLTWGKDSVTMYAMPQGLSVWSRPVRVSPTTCVLNATASTVVIAGGEHDTTYVVRSSDGSVITTLPRRWQQVRWADVSPDGSLVAVVERDSMVSIFSVNNPATPRRIHVTNAQMFYRAVFSPDGKHLTTTDSKGASQLWDTRTFDNPLTIANRQFINDNTYAAFSPDGRRLAIETGTDETKIVDVATARHVVSIRRLQEPGGAGEAEFFNNGNTLLLSTLSFVTAFDAYTGVQILRVHRGDELPTSPANGSRLAVINSSHAIDVYDLESPLLQQDTSDNYWALYGAYATIRPVRLPQRAVGQSVDSIVVDGITNTSRDPVTIKGIRIEGAQAADFGINAPKEFTIAPGETFPITYSFHPNAVGERAALIVAESSSGIINARISGRCPGGVIRAGAESVDLGLVPIDQTVRIDVDTLVRNDGLTPIHVREVRMADHADPTIALVKSSGFTLQPGETSTVAVEVTAPAHGMFATQIEFLVDGLDEPVQATLYAHADSLVRKRGGDPTTFRAIMLPTAIVPEAGTITTGVYDVVGLSASYSITDNLAVLVGGALPLYKAWFGATGYDASYSTAWSIGAKVGAEVGQDWIVGGGYQFGQSYYDQQPTDELDSKITFNAFWATAGYGNDDSRLNVYLGYALKDHVTIVDGHFRADAVIAGIGYDYRISEHWKLCAETFFMRTMTFIPITVTARYFRETDAFEAGLSYVGIQSDGTNSTGWPLVPMLTWVKRW